MCFSQVEIKTDLERDANTLIGFKDVYLDLRPDDGHGISKNIKAAQELWEQQPESLESFRCSNPLSLRMVYRMVM